MAIEEILIGIGLDSKDFSNKIEALARQYDNFLKTVSHKPIDIRFSEEGVKTLQKSLEQARQNLTQFASSIKQKFQLEFNPNVANLDQIKSAVNDKISELQSVLDRSPLRVKIDPKIFSDAQKLLSTLEDIRKKEDSGGAAGPREQERVVSLLSKLQGLERIFNRGFFDKFNADSTTSGQKIDLLRTKLEQLSQLKAAQDRPNPALQNVIKQLADLQKAFFSAQSVVPSLRSLKEQVEGIFAQLNLLQSTKGIPQEVLDSFNKLSKTLHQLGIEEDDLRKKQLLADKETQEFDLLLAAEAADKKLQLEQNSLKESNQLDEKEVISTQNAEKAKTAAVAQGEQERSALNRVGLDTQSKQTEEATRTTLNRIRKVAIEITGAGFANPLKAIGRVSEDLSSSIDNNIKDAESLIRKFSSLKVPPDSIFSEKKLQENLLLQQELKKAYENTVAAALKLKDAEDLRNKASIETELGEKAFAVRSISDAKGHQQKASGFLDEAEAIERNFELASSRLIELKAQGDRSQTQLASKADEFNRKTLKDTQILDAKLKSLGEERAANELRLANERERIAKAGIFKIHNAEEQAIKKSIKARENLNTKLLELERILAAQRAAIQSSAAGLDAGQTQTFRERIRIATSEITRAKAEVTAFGRESEKLIQLGTPIQRIFSGFSKNIFESVGAVVKFNTAWRLTGAIIETALLPVTLFVGSIQRGFEFLIQVQQKLADVREVLLQNVTFSRVFAENFEIATKASEELVVQQERAAAQIGVQSEKFRQVFESFAVSGGLKAVQEAGETTEQSFLKANRSVALIITALNSVGVSTRDTRRVTNEINKLLEGQVTQRDKIRIASGLTAKELNKQSLEAQKQGKFLQFVDGLFKAQAERIRTADERFQELTTQIEFFINRFSALALQPTFNKLIEILRTVKNLLEDNEKTLQRIGRIFGIVFSKGIEGGLSFFSALGKVVSALGSVVDGLGKVIAKLIETEDQANKTTDSVQKKNASLLKSIGKGFILLGAIISDVFQASLDGFFTLLASILDLLKRSVQVAGNLIASLVSVMVGDLKGAKAAIDRAGEDIKSIFSLGTNDEFVKELKTRQETIERFATREREFVQEERFLRRELAEAQAKDDEKAFESAALRLSSLLNDQADLRRKKVEEERKFLKLEAEANANSFINATLGRFEEARKNIRQRNKQTADLLSELIGTSEGDQKEGIPAFVGKDVERVTDPKFDNAALQDALRQFREDAENIRNLFNELRDDIKEAVSENALDIAEARVQLIGTFEVQGQALSKLAEDFIKNINKVKGAASLKEVEKTRDQVRLLQIKNEEESRKNIAKITREGLAEDKKLELEKLKTSRDLLVQEGQARLELIRSQSELGLKLKSDIAQEEIDLNRRVFNESLKINDLELDIANQNTQEFEKILNERAKFIIDFNTKNTQLVIDRIRLLEEETIVSREQARAIFEIRNQLNQDLNNLASQSAVTELERVQFSNRNLQLQKDILAERLKQNQAEFESNERIRQATREKLAELAIVKQTNELSKVEAEQLLVSQRTLEEKSQIYRRLKVQQEELNAEIEKQNILIKQGNLESNAQKNPLFLLLRDLIGNLPSSRVRQISQTEIKFNKEGVAESFEPAVQGVVEATNPLVEAFKLLTAGGQTTASSLSFLVGSITNMVNGVIAAFGESKLAGIGNIAQTVGGFIPGPVGAVLQIGGQIAQAISGIFTALARRIAENIKKSIDNILRNLERGITGLGDAIVQLENKRLEAIRRLSGKKGGQKQLDEILPGLEDQIEDLKKQQFDLQQSFEDQLFDLRQGNTVLGDFARKWRDINKTVKEYLRSFATGSKELDEATKKAQEFLSLQLKQIQLDAQEELNDAEQQAIDNALELNDLLEQRIKLIEDFEKREFELLAGGALERQQSAAVLRARELVDARAEFEKQKQALDDQIKLKTIIVNKEKEVFNLAGSIAGLKKRSEELTLSNLDKQITRWQSLRDIISGITDSNGLFGIDPSSILAGITGGNTTSITVGSVSFHVNTGGAPFDGQQAANEFTKYLNDLQSSGRTF